MSDTTNPTCACGHPADVHSNMPGIGCLEAVGDRESCLCNCTRRSVQRTADTLATAQALDAVERGTSPAWAAQAVQAVAHLADLGRPFTSDDVWDRLTDLGVEAPAEPRALGPIVKAALREGRIRLEGYATSRRRHQSIIRSYVGVK